MWVSGFEVPGMHHEYPDGREGPVSVVQSGAGQAVIFCGESVDGMIFHAANCVSEYLSLTLPVDMLVNLIGQDDAMEVLTTLGVFEHQGNIVRDFPVKLLKPLEQSMSGPYRGVAQRLYCMARILDFLASLVHHCRSQNDERERGNRRHKTRV